MENFLNQFSKIEEGALYLKDYFDFFNMEPGIKKPENPRPFPEAIKHGITFESVSFRYTNTEQWAVKNLNFSSIFDRENGRPYSRFEQWYL